MKIEIFTLCDYATVDVSGKLTIVGSFDHYSINEEPATLPQCSVAAKIRFDKGEEGKKNLKLTIIDSDGKPIIKDCTAQIDVRILPNALNGIYPFAMIFQMLRIPTIGEYAIDLELDGQHVASVPLTVSKRQ